MDDKSWIALALETQRKPRLFWSRVQKKNFPKITESVDAFIEVHQQNGIEIITPPYFPDSLRKIPDPPCLIFLKGQKSTLKMPCVGIIGSRQGSLLARQWTQDASKALSEAGYTIVSGLAKGIDGAAHIGALSTIAVVAGSVDYVYPQENKQLFQNIPSHGCIISEEPFQTKAQASFFPKRNRIIAALSQALVVVEAAKGSGSIITVKAALEYGKTIFVVPGPPWDTRYSGSLNLLRDGASLCVSAQDVLDCLLPLTFSYHKKEESPLFLPALSKKDFLSLLSSSPFSIHHLYQSYDSVSLIRIISELEIEGLIEKIGDKIMLSQKKMY